MILFDTHVLIWWLREPAELSSMAMEWIERSGPGDGIVFISVVSLCELEYKRRMGKLPLEIPIREAWPMLQKLPVKWLTPSVDDWLLAAELEWEHRDPADRLIAATALNRNIPVLTKDRRFHEPDCPVKAVW